MLLHPPFCAIPRIPFEDINADTPPIPSTFQQDLSSCIVHTELSFTEATYLELTILYCATCIYRQCHHLSTLQVTVIDSVSQSNCHFDTNSFQKHLIILQRYSLLETLIHPLESLLSFCLTAVKLNRKHK